SEGAEIAFKVADTDIVFKVFTTRADTLYGVTYVVLAPENPIVGQITKSEYAEAVEKYKNDTKKQTEIERLSTTKEKTGVFTGSYAIHPITGEKVPVWIADYVLASYGTGCVMAVPSHDERDYEFAKKYDLPIKRVIKSADGSDDGLPYCEYGVLVNSAEFDGISSAEARTGIIKKLEGSGKGSLKVNYRLRDWLVSRQRYWGAPIPVVYCEHCGEVAVPEEDLPVALPYNVEFKPDGESPLKKSDEFMNTVCPKCGAPAKRDPDTLDTFVCSSWYYLRYPDSQNSDKAFDTEWINKMLPVDKYVGGAEHAAMHLLYARFITKALRDLGFVNFDEPFLSLVHQGTILGPDGNRMSKSRGNTISPDEYVRKYGSDIFRMYLAFGFNYVDGGPWSDDGIKAISSFATRIERLVESLSEQKSKNSRTDFDKDDKELNFVRHMAIKGASQDTDRFQFNTVISRCMELVNALYKYDAEVKVKNIKLFGDTITDLIKLVSPFAPHFAEEMWEQLGNEYSIFNQEWPEFDEKALVKDTIELAVQVNGTVRGKIEAAADAENSEVEAVALNDEKIRPFLDGKEIKKVIIVKGRLVNIVAK
ncbi:MAG TPA: leucine--tRNA ligase, partial [Ruminiclostridium sp.]|nr:leucine--tRNA ligase [Ruminiclostridium sp.]